MGSHDDAKTTVASLTATSSFPSFRQKSTDFDIIHQTYSETSNMYNRVKGLVGIREGAPSPPSYMPRAQPLTRSVEKNDLHSSYSQKLAALGPRDASLSKMSDINLEVIGQSPKRGKAPILNQYQLAGSTLLPFITVNQKVIQPKPVVAIEKPARYPKLEERQQRKATRALPKIQPELDALEINPTTRLPLVDISNNKVSTATDPPRPVTLLKREKKTNRLRAAPANHLPRSTLPGMANKPEYVAPMLVSSSAPSMPSRHAPPMMLGVTATCLRADRPEQYLPGVYDRRPYQLPPISMTDGDSRYNENTCELLQPFSMAKHAMSAKVKRDNKKNGSRRR